jgi:hypothetical protein
VDGNVCTVQSKNNGTATITVDCGQHSATCTVSVSGIEWKAPDDITWTDTPEYNLSGGNLTSGNCYVSDFISIEPGYTYKVTAFTGGNYTRVSGYKEDGTYVKNYGEQGNTHYFNVPADDTVRKIRIGIYPTTQSVDFTEVTIIRGYAEWEKGEIGTNGQPNDAGGIRTIEYIVVKPNTAYCFERTEDCPASYLTVAEYDSSYGFVSYHGNRGDENPANSPRHEFTTTADTAYVKLCCAIPNGWDVFNIHNGLRFGEVN